ncbi:MAG TPA: hypothetical protein VMU01_01380 [Rhizomicrobium sp.]|nr:hypothetical protein [Rhizomicrobium sp.]
MNIKKLLLTAAAAGILVTTGAAARDFDRDGRPGYSMAVRHDGDGYRDLRGHDRYWREGYRGYVGRDVIFAGLRNHNYYRWAGDPYWFQGHYVVRTYDSFGRAVFVEVNPYTGGFVGVLRF